jgi:hypothetical protein
MRIRNFWIGIVVFTVPIAAWAQRVRYPVSSLLAPRTANRISWPPDDPRILTKPVIVKFNFRLFPDTDLIESFCSENEKDLGHIAAR